MTVRVGADVGGTFTDLILMDTGGDVWTYKVPSSPPAYEQAVLRALEQLIAQAEVAPQEIAQVAHGTTVATNAVLEHRGARTALITTQGFRDVLELRRVRAPQMYDLFWEKPAPLVERAWRFEIGERIAADGTVLQAVDEQELWALKEKIERAQSESLAVCLLHAYAYPQHELRVGEFFRVQLPQLEISLSHQILPERQEYERTATAVVNAYVRPVMQKYLNALRGGLNQLGVEAPLQIMQSAGGLTPDTDAAIRPVYSLESGPAAGVLAAAFAARQIGLSNVITLDVGGTTAKASIIENGQVSYSAEYEVGSTLSAANRLVGGGGDRIRAPSIDIAEVGSGGGSIAYLDSAGGLRVGPRSAGALPGPACYQRGGTQPTVTDANVALGYIRPGKLANGDIRIDVDAALRAIHDHIAQPLGMSVLEAAEGIHRIANARTMRALRAVSTERGRDPRDFVLIAFGGSGPIHAAHLAREMYVPQVVVPPLPGLFSALGLLFSGVEHHAVRSCMLAGDALNAHSLQSLRDEMTRELLTQFVMEGFDAAQVAFHCSFDVRYQGQASEIRIPLAGDAAKEPFSATTIQNLIAAFAQEHKRLYGHTADPNNPVQVIAARVIGSAGATQHDAVLRVHQNATWDGARTRRAYFGATQGVIETPVVARAALADGAAGPLLIDEYDSTTVIPPGLRVRLDARGNLIVSIND